MDNELQRPFEHTLLTRRRLFGSLAATAVGAGVLAACGDSVEYTLVTRFPGTVLTPGEVRLPYQLSTGAANIVSDGPEQLGAQLADADGVPIGAKFNAAKRQVDPFPYYDFHVHIDEPGVYTLLVDNGPADGVPIQVVPADAIAVPSAGMMLPALDTPTTADDRGFETICTRTPDPCPFHEITLTEALSSGQPVIYYVGTPAFCSTGSCGPALESLIEAADEFGDRVAFVHAEVFSDNAGTVVAEAVNAVGLFYEPALFVTDTTGVIQQRIDAIWGLDEINEVLARAVA